MKQGIVFIVTTGEYSDFGIYSKLRSRVTFSFDRELARYLDANKDQAAEYRFRSDAFIDHLLATNLVELVEIPEVHLSSYSTPEKDPASDAEDDAAPQAGKADT